jgi:hypothetical protein
MSDLSPDDRTALAALLRSTIAAEPHLSDSKALRAILDALESPLPPDNPGMVVARMRGTKRR